MRSCWRTLITSRGGNSKIWSSDFQVRPNLAKTSAVKFFSLGTYWNCHFPLDFNSLCTRLRTVMSKSLVLFNASAWITSKLSMRMIARLKPFSSKARVPSRISHNFASKREHFSRWWLNLIIHLLSMSRTTPPIAACPEALSTAPSE